MLMMMRLYAELYMDVNDIGNEGAASFASLLKVNKTIKHVSVNFEVRCSC